MSKDRNGARIVPADEGMAEAVATLHAGGLVAFPTETVYGLGANALDAEAVAKIFAVKGRPATNPLIVHVADADAARRLASDWPGVADTLAERFWPGPLTLVVPRSPNVPDIVTAGGSTVGLRVPAHPVALRLIREAGVPVAAPSSNRSEEVSPTTARHVADSLGPHVDDLLILDGGPTQVGIESTVLDVTTNPARILRPGMVTAAALRELMGMVVRGATAHEERVARSPGMATRHYSPRKPLHIIPHGELFNRLHLADGLIYHSEVDIGWRVARSLHLPKNAADYAARLYAALRTLDEADVPRIMVEDPPNGPEWSGIRDRLRRAATPRDTTPSSPAAPREGDRGGKGS